MGGSSDQVTGYRYYANFLLFIGNPIEKLISINFDKRGWVPYNQFSTDYMLNVDEAYMYGENEGGVFGDIDIHIGTANQEPNATYKAYMESIGLKASGFPYQSYLVFRGSPNAAIWSPAYGQGFYLGNSGYMKEMLLWPKRIHVKNDGQPQWYDERSEIAYINSNNVSWLETRKNSEIVIAEANSRLQNIWYGSLKVKGGAFETIMVDGEPSRGLKGTAGVWHFDAGTTGEIDDVGRIKTSFNTGLPVLIELTLLCDDGLHGFVWTGDHSYVIDQWSELGWVTCKKIILVTNNLGEGDLVISVVNGRPSGSASQHRVMATCSLLDDIDNSIMIPSLDINPIHKIREILTDDTAMNKPESEINDANFRKAASRIWDEGLGISWAITEKSCIDAINELCSHIEAGIRVNRQTGLYEMVLFRDDWFEEDEIHTLAENKIKSISFEVQNADDVINQLNVSYYDRTNIKDTSFSISENASIKNMSGRVNAESSDFPYFMNQRNAAIVAQWKLKQMTSPCLKGSFKTGYSEARKWNRYDIIKLNWSRKGIADLPVRIMSVDLGNGIDNTVSIDFIEVISFSNKISSSIVIDEKIDTTPIPPKPVLFKSFELSYFEAVQVYGQRNVDDQLAYNPDSGYVSAVAKKPQDNSLNAQLHTDFGNGYENVAIVNYCVTANLDQNIDKISASFIVKSVSGLSSVRVGSQIFINNEIMVFESFDATTKIVSVKRGALDSVPQNHAVDSVLFFADDFVAIDSAEYADSEVINVKALSTTPSGVLDLNAVTAQSVEIQSRAIRPYPPANVKINSEYYPAEIETDLILTWMDRNRVQQTGGSILGWFDAGVTLENGVTYQLVLVERDENLIELRTQSINVGTLNIYTFATSAMNANTRTIEITLKSLRDGYECFQPFNHTVELSQFFSAPYNLSVVYKND